MISLAQLNTAIMNLQGNGIGVTSVISYSNATPDTRAYPLLTFNNSSNVSSGFIANLRISVNLPNNNNTVLATSVFSNNNGSFSTGATSYTSPASNVLDMIDIRGYASNQIVTLCFNTISNVSYEMLGFVETSTKATLSNGPLGIPVATASNIFGRDLGSIIKTAQYIPPSVVLFSTPSSAFIPLPNSALFLDNGTYTMPYSATLNMFLIGGGGSGASTHGTGGSAGTIARISIFVNVGSAITIVMGKGGASVPPNQGSQSNHGGITTLTVNGTTYRSDSSQPNAANGGTAGGSNPGSSGGGGAGNSGSAGSGGSGGSNGGSGANIAPGVGMGTTAFNNVISGIAYPNTNFNFRIGTGGAAGVSSHSGGGGAGGIIASNLSFPTAGNGASGIYSAKGGIGFGAGGGAGGYTDTTSTYFAGGAGADGLVYIWFT